MSQNAINLNIIIKKNNAEGAPYYTAEAVQVILIKYFTLQLLSIKKNIPELSNFDAIQLTRKWLANNCPKNIIFVETEIWDKIQVDFVVGKDLFLIKDHHLEDLDTALVFWPHSNDFFPSYLLNGM